jgi:hypothetical protein
MKASNEMYRVVKVVGEAREIVMSDKRGEPISKDEADRMAVRFSQSETDSTARYEVEAF